MWVLVIVIENFLRCCFDLQEQFQQTMEQMATLSREKEQQRSELGSLKTRLQQMEVP